ncbi:MAG: TonB-dependent receptor [Campylobacteraceae bacterium]|nr:TonB-dependent receptor [Campylobacteraceae bacterium]
MKLFRGYKKRYFSLAAILACSAGVSLEANSIAIEAKEHENTQSFASEKEVETEEEMLDVIHVISGVEKKKSYEYSSSRALKQKSHTIDSVEIITSEEIDIKGFQNVIEALNFVAGISSTTNGGYGQSSSLYLRGFDSKHTLVLIDGVRVNDISGLSGAQMELIDLYNIDRIEVVKGAQSGVWGSDANGGVVNIITKSNKQGFSGDMLVEFGSNDWRKYTGSFGYTGKIFDISLSFLSLQTDGISAAAPKKGDVRYADKNLDWEKDGFKNGIVHIKSGINLSDNDRLELSMMNGEAKNHFDGGAGVDADDYDDLYGYGTDKYFNTIRTSLYSLGYIGKYKTHKIDARVNYSSFKRSFYDGYIGRTYESYASDEWSYANASSLLLGLGYLKDEVKLSAGAKFPNDNQNSKYIFAVNSNTIGNFTISQSLRFDMRDTFEDKSTFKVGAKYNFYKDLFVLASYKTGFLAPNLYQQNYGVTKNLKAEESSGYEFSLGVQNFLLTYFDYRIKNAIDYGGVWPLDFYYNIDGKSRFRGVEASANQRFFEHFLGELSYTYLNVKDAAGKHLARRPQNKIAGSLSWFINNSLYMSLKGSYVGSRYDTNRVQTGKYFLADYIINHDFNKHMSAYFKAHNIFDKYYQEIDGYGTLGRNFYIGIRGSF